MKCPYCSYTLMRQLNHLYCSHCDYQAWELYEDLPTRSRLSINKDQEDRNGEAKEIGRVAENTYQGKADKTKASSDGEVSLHP